MSDDKNKIRVSRMHKGDYGKIKAFFDVEVIAGFVVKGFKIVQGKDGLFVGNPSTKQKDEYQDQVFLATDIKKKVTEIGINEFNGVNDTQEEEFDDFDKI
jgi:DNA-binding cell septation regulator SpoVG